MNSLPKPEVILTHESDLDGLLSGVLLQRLAHALFGAEVRLEAYHYNHWKQREMREAAAWVADFSFESRLDRPGWAILDHHPKEATAQKALLIHDLNKSAAALCYDLCKLQGLGSPTLDRLVHINNVADLFLEQDPDFILSQNYANLVKTYGFWNVMTLIDGKLEQLLNHPLLEVMETKRRVENPIGLEWARKHITEISRTVGFVDTLIGNTNIIVHEILKRKLTQFPVLITLFRRPNGLVIASVRSREGEAVKVAERLQGGGHPNAAGALLPKSVKNVSDGVEYLKKVLNPSPGQIPLNHMASLFDGLELK